MAGELLLAVPVLFAIGLLAALIERSGRLARVLLALGCIAGIAACIITLPRSSADVAMGYQLADTPVCFMLSPAACWLLLFGLIPALLAVAHGSTAAARSNQTAWLAGAALSLLGAVGVFGLQDAMSFLLAWEVMSLGGAVMILGEGLSVSKGGPALFMLALLEVGAVALLLCFLLMGNHAVSVAFSGFATLPLASSPIALLCGLLLLIGFGAKLGVLPFYEWFPAAYGSGSGATGVLFSGVVLNAAFYAFSRGLLLWLPHRGAWMMALAIIVIIAGVLTAILAILNAFQEEDWRRLLSLSSAENSGIAVAAFGASLLFSVCGLSASAALAWIVCLIHLAGHSLAKGTLFLTADSVYTANGTYLIRQNGLVRNTTVLFGIGALFAAMSLAALPPQAGFVSEWYVFQTLFQGMQIGIVAARLTIALAAAGLALVAAVALATFAKLFGIGLLGNGHDSTVRVPARRSASIFFLGTCVLALAVGMPWWIQSLGVASRSLFGTDAAALMKNQWLLVPLSSKFAFISPTKLVIAGPLLALIPILLLLFGRRQFRVRRAPVWSGGRQEDARHTATTSLAFSNALRTFYGFIYGPTHSLEREYGHGPAPYFVKRLIFNQEVAPIFGPYFFAPVTRIVRLLSARISVIQSGYLNFYNALIGLLLVLILALALFYK